VTGSVWPPELVALYRDSYARSVRLAFLVCDDPAAAEEVVQDAFVGLHRRWGEVRHPGAYLRAAVVNGARTRVRQAGRVSAVASVPDRAIGSAPDELADALARLRPERRAALVLRFYEGVPDAEAAEILGCRPATVRSMVRRALADLRAQGV
jgi:RNA polymerase sigma factor (sigma-70 family)